MIVQACLNGARPSDWHSRLPLTPEAMAQDAVRCISAGAAELHVHPRDAAGRESLFAVDETVAALRSACPGTLIGVSTGDWIEKDQDRTLSAIEGWAEPPDYASVNLVEKDAPSTMDALLRRGVGIEAGLATVADAERLCTLPGRHRVLRVLIEIEEQDSGAALAAADAIARILQENGLRKPILLHGFDASVWPLVERTFERFWSTRVGLEDGRLLPDGTVAAGNADLVRAATELRPAAAN
ncbi:MAG: 3-keto-5-aminohexanoate cleavage enzyme [Ahrensia sp.]|nr:3-keto-5-aminohexanoate cleavage enzyme [Ahrensia sp.]